MLHQVNEIVEQEITFEEDVFFGAFHRLDHEQVVFGEEEKRGTFATTRLKTIYRVLII